MTSDRSINSDSALVPVAGAEAAPLSETSAPDADSRAAERADDVLRLATTLTGMPVACLGLTDSAEIWSVDGLHLGATLAGLHGAFARLAIDRVQLLSIALPLTHPAAVAIAREIAVPLGAFVGVPLVSAQGDVVGVLTLFDKAPRRLSKSVVASLEALARQCARGIEARRSLRRKREAEQRLALIFESAIDYAIMALDTEGRITSWNTGAQHIFGWREDEMLGQAAAFLFTAEDRQAGAPALDLIRAAEHGREIEERYYERKNGSLFWGTGETMPLVTRSGATRGYLKILRDRTSAKRIKEALEYQTSVLQAITDHMAEALFQVDVDYRITFLNPAAEDMFGWSRYELIGVDLHDRMHYIGADGLPSMRSESPYVVALESRASLLRRPDVFVHHDGHLLDVLVSCKPVVSDGIVTGGVLTLVDVTETRKIEAALRATQERYQLAVSASDIVGSWDWDLIANTITADATFAMQYGVDPRRAERGAPVADFEAGIHPDDRDDVFAAIEISMRDKTSYVGEYRLLRPDGSIRWVSTYARCIYDAGGQPVRCPGLSVDITERKQNEERRAALLELEDALRNKESIADISGLAAEIVCRLLRVKRAGFGLVDPSGDYVVIERDHAQDGSDSISGVFRFAAYGSYGEALKAGTLVVVNDVAHDPRTDEHGPRWATLDVGALVNVPLKAEGRLAAMFFAHSATTRFWTQDDIGLIANIADRTWSAIARAQATAQERMLTGELHHRVKNTITMIHAIANQTMRKADTKQEAFLAFEARLLALSEAQNILMRSSWSAASMMDVMEGSLTPHRPAGRERILVEGPDTNLSAQTALSFALALHELATNATKYGALSNDAGAITVTWRFEDEGSQPIFRFRWQEKGGPPVAVPTRKGFGSRLIKGGFARAFTIVIDYDPAGVICDISGPMLAL